MSFATARDELEGRKLLQLGDTQPGPRISARLSLAAASSVTSGTLGPDSLLPPNNPVQGSIESCDSSRSGATLSGQRRFGFVFPQIQDSHCYYYITTLFKPSIPSLNPLTPAPSPLTPPQYSVTQLAILLPLDLSSQLSDLPTSSS
jgi:hypothetical protein